MDYKYIPTCRKACPDQKPRMYECMVVAPYSATREELDREQSDDEGTLEQEYPEWLLRESSVESTSTTRAEAGSPMETDETLHEEDVVETSLME